MAKNTDLELGDADIVDQTVQLLLAREVRGHDRLHRPSIFKVPSVQRDMSPSSYNPKVVSIGPLHKEAKNVQAMEELKATYLHNLLASLDLPREQTLEACVHKVTASIDKIKQSYDEIKSYTHVQLAEMMVMDGIFILDFVYNVHKHFSDVLLSQSIIEDLVLLENQIPFFVLQDLFKCTILKRKPSASLIGLILPILIYVPLLIGSLPQEDVLRGTTPDHILGLLHMCYHPNRSVQPKCSKSGIRSATELDRAGVKFEPIQDPNWPMAIEFKSSRFRCFSWFWGKPTLRIPIMYLNDFTESITKNLIVYEQSSSLVPTYITSYVSAFDYLVDTKEDIAMLMESGVLCNYSVSNEEAANIINRINQKIHHMDFFYGEQWDALNRYCNGYWPKYIARLRRTYFSSPWNIIALLAGIVLFALTIVQTIFTINPV